FDTSLVPRDAPPFPTRRSSDLGLFTPGMLAIDGSLSSRQHCCFAPVEIVFKFASRRSDVRGGNTQVFTSAFGVGQRVLQGRVWPVSWIILPVVFCEGCSAWRKRTIDGSPQACIGLIK